MSWSGDYLFKNAHFIFNKCVQLWVYFYCMLKVSKKINKIFIFIIF